MLDRLALMLGWLRALSAVYEVTLRWRTSRYGSYSRSCLAAIHARD
jgi:hypothetical protein